MFCQHFLELFAKSYTVKKVISIAENIWWLQSKEVLRAKARLDAENML